MEKFSYGTALFCMYSTIELCFTDTICWLLAKCLQITCQYRPVRNVIWCRLWRRSSTLWCREVCWWLKPSDCQSPTPHWALPVFNSMVYSCLYHDRASFKFSHTELVAARMKELQLTLSSGKQDYESIVLPANYIQGFLQAVQWITLPIHINRANHSKQPRLRGWICTATGDFHEQFRRTEQGHCRRSANAVFLHRHPDGEMGWFPPSSFWLRFLVSWRVSWGEWWAAWCVRFKALVLVNQ